MALLPMGNRSHCRQYHGTCWYRGTVGTYRSTSTVGTYGTVGTVLAGTVVLAGTWYRGTTVLVLRYLLVARVP